MFNIFNIKEKKVLFIHIPKTAGTSIVHCLSNGNTEVKHILFKKYSEHSLKNVFTFCVIRNPFDRFISQWLYHTNFKDNFFSKKYNKKFDVFSYLNLVKKNNQRVTWQPISNFIEHNTKKIDFILRFEKLESDWQHLCSILGTNMKLDFLKKNNERNHYSFYYNNFLISEVEKIYKEDIINFNYTFENI
jgi:hypothetical protein